MISNKQYLGEFWNPTIAENRLAGLLYYENSKIFLKCYGKHISQTEYMSYDLNYHKSFPIVFGICLELGNLTLINLKQYSYRSINSRKEITYSVDYLLFGSNYLNSLDDKIINYSMLTFFKMNEFMNSKVIESKASFKNGFNANIKVNGKKPITIQNSKKQKDYIFHRLNVSQPKNSTDDLVKSDFYFNSSYKKPISFFQFIDNIKSLQSFFSLAVSKPQAIYKAFIQVGNIEMEFVTADIIKNRDNFIKHFNEVVINFSDILVKKNIPLLYWLSNFKNIEHSFYLYEDAITNFKSLPLKNYFLNLFFCNETILKTIVNIESQNTQALNKINKIISDYKLRSNDKEFLLKRFKLKYPGIESYFDALNEKLPKTITEIFGSDYKSVILTAKNTRDSLVHKNIESIKTVLSTNAEYLNTSNKLRVLFQASCLLCMGFVDEEICKMLFRYPSNTFDVIN